MTEPGLTTWDGLPISPIAPFGATIVVYRRVKDGLELLILHRAHNGPAYEGEWAWTPPSGARLPNEPVEDCARRELLEETGLALPVQALRPDDASWALYSAEAPLDTVVTLDAEHDRFAWVTVEEALARCQPDQVSAAVQYAARLVYPAGV